MTKRLLWLVGAGAEAKYVARLTDVLSTHHHLNTVLLAPFDSVRDELQGLGYSCLGLSDVLATAGFCDYEHQNLIATANELLAKLDINMLLHSDQLLYQFVDRGVAQDFIARAILGIHELLQQGQYAGCMRYGTGSAIGRALSILAESLEIRSYALASCVGFDTCGLIPVGVEEQWQWTSFAKCWQIWQDRTVPESDREKINRYITSYFQSHRARPRTRWWLTNTELLSEPGGRRWVTDRIAAWRQRKFNRVSSQIKLGNTLHDASLDALIPLWNSYLHSIRSQWVQSYREFSYDQIPDRYIYMPLNFKWDAPHRAWNSMNYLQEYLVTVVAASLPYGYQLVIKEHPYGMGDPPHRELKELQDIGVRVVHPHTHSLELIRNAEAVFCVGDTTGWEAILFKVPVIVFGARPFYVKYPYLWAITDHNRVHEALREAVKSKDDAYANEDLWYSFIQSALEASYPGNIWGYKSLVWLDADESEDNLTKIAYMIVKEGDFSL